MTRASRALVFATGAFLAISLTNSARSQSTPAKTGKELEITITANRTPTAIQRTGSAITVLSGEDIRKTSGGSLVDALRYVPGLDITETGGPGGTTAVRLRGANAGQTLVLVDGVRVNDPSGASGEFDFASLAPGLIDRIEVLRGPQSALYGSDAIGGVINIITKKGRGPLQTYGQIEGGSYGTLTGNAGAFGTRGPWDYALAVSAFRTDGFSRYGYRVGRVESMLPPLEKDSVNRYGAYGRIGYAPGTGFRFEIGTMATFTRAAYDAGFGTFPDTPSRANSLFHSSFAKAELDTFDGRLKHSIQLFSSRTKRDYRDISFGATQLPADTFFNKYEYIGSRTGAEYQGTLGLNAFGSLIFGGRYEREMIDSYSESITPFPAPRTKDVGKGQDTRSAFALWQLPLGERLDLSLGGRVDDVVNTVTFKTWRATLAYRILETDTKLRASLGTGGKAPTLYQLYAPFFGTPTLQPEHSFGGDIGIDQHLFNGRAKISITGFANRINNLIDFDFGTFTYQNTARAETSGVEVAGDAVLVPEKLVLKGAYTFLRAKDRNTGLTLARRPEQTGKIGLTITPYENWAIEPSVTMVSFRYSSTNQTQRLAPYARLDTLVNYRVNANMDVYLRGENLTNARYQSVRNYGTTGRAIYAGMKTTW